MVLLGKDTKINAHRDNHIEAEHLYKSAVLYLSDDFDGGYLEFINNNLTLKPKKFSLIMFESTIEHRVTNIKRGARYALPMWASKGAKYNLFDNDNHPVKSNKDWHFAIKENKK
jgi:predicted 2-oxoglutarate/Fe(II)-dependent dioxygenase YbiX